MKKGTFEVIVGCMSSGKSEELIRRLRREVIARRRVAVFKPERDTRTGRPEIASRDGRSLDAVPVSTPADVLAWVERESFDGTVGIDEAQFFSADIVEAVEALVARGLRVIAAGLDTDFRGRPFGAVPHLLAVADSVTKLSAVCVRCGAPAVRTQLKAAPPAEGNIRVGGDESYEARCRDCHETP